MDTSNWRKRLASALQESGKSKRSVSLGAGLGAGYVHSILAEGKDPTIGKLVAVCREIGVSLSSILYGIKMSPETEAIVRELESSSPARRAGLLQFLKDGTPSGDDPSLRRSDFA